MVARDRCELLLDVSKRLAGERAPLDRDDATVGIRRELLAAFDQRRVHGRAAEKWMGPVLGAQGLVEVGQPQQDRPRPRDRIDAEVVARSVRCDAAGRDLGSDEALVRDDELHLGGLGDDCSISRDRLRDGLGPML